MIERALIWPAWAITRGLFLAFYYPMLGLGHLQAWLAAGYRETRRRENP